jgi:hypothetical protein
VPAPAEVLLHADRFLVGIQYFALKVSGSVLNTEFSGQFSLYVLIRVDRSQQPAYSDFSPFSDYAAGR